MWLLLCVCVLCLCLIDNISSKIVPLEKGVVIYGANALSLLPVVGYCLYNLLTGAERSIGRGHVLA